MFSRVPARGLFVPPRVPTLYVKGSGQVQQPMFPPPIFTMSAVWWSAGILPAPGEGLSAGGLPGASELSGPLCREIDKAATSVGQGNISF
jgi:hypothetical protein